MKAVTTKQMREMDRATSEDYGFPGQVLMENAGRAVAEAAVELLPPAGRVLVLAGKGNNGGDGFTAARHLTERGYHAEIVFIGEPEQLRSEAALNLRHARAFGIPIREKPDDAAILELLGHADVVIDALLGTGLSGAVTGRMAEVLALLSAHKGPIVAVDVPSGLDADTGRLLGPVSRADITVTFGLPKQGLYLFPGRACCGRIRVAPIGLAPEAVRGATPSTWIVDAPDVAAAIPTRRPDAHKGDAGRLLVIAGSGGLTGAAAMAANAAMRAGAGLVTLACPASLNPIIEQKCTEAMSAPLMDHGCGYLRPRNTEELLTLAQSANAVVIGPGLGSRPATADMVRELLTLLSGPVILDADGINAFAGIAPQLAERSCELTITPHPGELARLIDLSIDKIQSDRVAIARECAAELGATVLLKGAGTVTAEPGGEVWINTTGSSAMAGGGMGDVLSGVVGAFAAGGMSAASAAWAAVWVHGRAGDIAAGSLGPRGIVATDLLPALPRVFAELSCDL